MATNRKLFQNIPVKYPDKIIDISNVTCMADLKVGLPSDEGYTMFLLVINSNTRQIDAVPLKTKTATEVAQAFREIWKRREIRNIRSTKRLITDLGSEFKGAFSAFLKELNVELIPYNHYHKNSTALAERAIGTVTKVLLEELSKQSLQTRRRANAWTKMLPIIVKEINRHATPRHTLKDLMEPPLVYKDLHPIGTVVHRKLQTPVHLLNEKRKYAFRNGDKRFSTEKHVITDYRIRDGGRPVSYILDNDYSIAYQHHEVLPTGGDVFGSGLGVSKEKPDGLDRQTIINYFFTKRIINEVANDLLEGDDTGLKMALKEMRFEKDLQQEFTRKVNDIVNHEKLVQETMEIMRRQQNN